MEVSCGGQGKAELLWCFHLKPVVKLEPQVQSL